MEEKDNLQENMTQPESVSENLAEQETQNDETVQSKVAQQSEPSENQGEILKEQKEKKVSGKKEKKPRQPKEKKKKNATQNTEALSDDDLFAQVQTEKLLKRKRHKKIATLASLCVAFVLALAVVILAAVPVGLIPKCFQLNELSNVTLYGKSASPSSLDVSDPADKEKLELFKKYYNQAFSQSCLSALFSGSLGDYEVDEQTYRSTSVTNDIATTLKGENYAGSGNYLIRFVFNERTLTTKNGGKYDSTYGSPSVWDLQLKFSQAFVVVNKDAGIKDTKIFIVATYPESNGDVPRLVMITTKADTSKIYNAWSELTR